MRDDVWLETRFEQIWTLFFPDVEKKNISIRWKGKWKNKFGHISWNKKKEKHTEIVINSLFKDLRVPEDVVKVTIAHEIAHYAHGFYSHLPRKYKHPHKGGVVDKELKTRGFSYMLKQEKAWHKEHWFRLYRELHPTAKTRSQVFQTQLIQPPKAKKKQRTLFGFFRV